MGLIDKIDPPQPFRFVINWGRRYRLGVMSFGSTCCAIELIAPPQLEPGRGDPTRHPADDSM